MIPRGASPSSIRLRALLAAFPGSRPRCRATLHNLFLPGVFPPAQRSPRAPVPENRLRTALTPADPPRSRNSRRPNRNRSGVGRLSIGADIRALRVPVLGGKPLAALKPPKSEIRNHLSRNMRFGLEIQRQAGRNHSVTPSTAGRPCQLGKARNASEVSRKSTVAELSQGVLCLPTVNRFTDRRWLKGKSRLTNDRPPRPQGPAALPALATA